jgi:hypothetical protein
LYTEASSPITTGSTTITNNYPDSVLFEMEATSTAGSINAVELHIGVRGSPSLRVEPAEFEPGPQVNASYAWSTFQQQIAPGTPVEISWVVQDDAGNKHTSGPEQYVVLDAGFDWQSLETEDVILWWYEGDEEFGQLVFDSATRALAELKANTGRTLPYRLHVVIYSNDEDFDAWHSYVREWVAGEAHPEQGLTIQIIPPDRARVNEWYTKDMMPHEIAHLFFYQVAHAPTGFNPPTWLNEGFAQYHEFLPQEHVLQWVRDVALQDELIPLRILGGAFTGDEQRIHLQYAESLSAVTFLFERWGTEGMSTLLSAFKNGSNTDEAIALATGLTFEEFQLAWWEWLGGQPGAYPTSAARSLPTMPPLNTPRSLATRVPNHTATETPGPASAQVLEPTPTPSPSARPTLTPSRSPEPGARTENVGNSLCPGPLSAFTLLLGAAIILSRRRAQID